MKTEQRLLDEQDISMMRDAMRSGVEFWKSLVDGAEQDGSGINPIVTMMKQQIDYVSSIMVTFDNVTSATLLVEVYEEEVVDE